MLLSIYPANEHIINLILTTILECIIINFFSNHGYLPINSLEDQLLMLQVLLLISIRICYSNHC